MVDTLKNKMEQLQGHQIQCGPHTDMSGGMAPSHLWPPCHAVCIGCLLRDWCALPGCKGLSFSNVYGTGCDRCTVRSK